MTTERNFDLVQWLPPREADCSLSHLVRGYHLIRGLDMHPVARHIPLGRFLSEEKDPDVVAFGMREGTYFMASPFLLDVDVRAEPWSDLRVAEREMRHVAHNATAAWDLVEWWVNGDLRRRVGVGYVEGTEGGLLEGEPAEFETPFWAWVGTAEPLADEDGDLPDLSDAWLEVVDVFLNLALNELLALDPRDISSWDWTVDTYRVPPRSPS